MDSYMASSNARVFWISIGFYSTTAGSGVKFQEGLVSVSCYAGVPDDLLLFLLKVLGPELAALGKDQVGFV